MGSECVSLKWDKIKFGCSKSIIYVSTLQFLSHASKHLIKTVLFNQAWKKYSFPGKLGQISLQHSRFSLFISLFLPQNHKKGASFPSFSMADFPYYFFIFHSKSQESFPSFSMADFLYLFLYFSLKITRKVLPFLQVCLFVCFFSSVMFNQGSINDIVNCHF